MYRCLNSYDLHDIGVHIHLFIENTCMNRSKVKRGSKEILGFSPVQHTSNFKTKKEKINTYTYFFNIRKSNKLGKIM